MSFLTRRTRRLFLLAAGAPLAARGLHRLADAIEARRGRSMLTSAVRGLATLIPGRRRRR
ncbi:MAG: hypothetical protein KY460_07150 [Actinobacteria bacterium]|nr:hypothetical protein [Actinomycetota bacterium]